jgi:hypothetical protein
MPMQATYAHPMPATHVKLACTHGRMEQSLPLTSLIHLALAGLTWSMLRPCPSYACCNSLADARGSISFHSQSGYSLSGLSLGSCSPLSNEQPVATSLLSSPTRFGPLSRPAFLAPPGGRGARSCRTPSADRRDGSLPSRDMEICGVLFAPELVYEAIAAI